MPMRRHSANRSFGSNTTLGLAAAVILVLFSSRTPAQMAWMVETGVTRTDNATLVSSGTTSDTIGSVGAAIAASRESRRISASLAGYGQYQRYMDNSFDDDVVGRAIGNVVIGFVPDRFTWTIEDTYGQIAVNAFNPVTVENRQGVNHFSTGPDLRLRLGPRMDLHIAGRYGDTRYERTDQVDTRIWGGSVALERNISGQSFLGFGVSQFRNSYDTIASDHYDQQAAYAIFNLTGARQSITAEVGANRIEDDAGSSTDPLVRLTWQRRISPSLTMNLRLLSEFMNTGQRFVDEASIGDPDTGEVGTFFTPSANKSAIVTFTFERPRTALNLSSRFQKIDYTGSSGVDEDRWVFGLDIARDITPVLRGYVDYRYVRRNYTGGGIFADNKDTRHLAGAGLAWQFGRNADLSLGYAYNHSTGTATINQYTAKSVYLQLTFRRGEIDAPRGTTY